MADYATRAKTIIANIKNKDQTVPGNAFLLAIAYSYVYAYRGRWEEYIASGENSITSNTPPERTVVNPANTEDPTDIGVLNTDTDVFTAASAGDKNKLFAQHFIREQRRFNRDILKLYRLQTTTITAGDAGETAEAFRAGVVSAAETEANTELGDDSNDPET